MNFFDLNVLQVKAKKLKCCVTHNHFNYQFSFNDIKCDVMKIERCNLTNQEAKLRCNVKECQNRNHYALPYPLQQALLHYCITIEECQVAKQTSKVTASRSFLCKDIDLLEVLPKDIRWKEDLCDKEVSKILDTRYPQSLYMKVLAALKTV